MSVEISYRLLRVYLLISGLSIFYVIKKGQKFQKFGNNIFALALYETLELQNLKDLDGNMANDSIRKLFLRISNVNHSD